MQNQLAAVRRISFNAVQIKPCVRKLGIVGAGEVVKKRLLPAISALAKQGVHFEKIVVCSLEAESPLNGFVHEYQPVKFGSLLPFDWLHEQGMLQKDTLWIIATPSEWHVPYALQLAGLCRVAIEKPIAANSEQARLLMALVENDTYPMDHKLFNASALSFVDECQRLPSPLRRICQIKGVFYEDTSFSEGRQQEDGIADIQWHLFTIMVSSLKALGSPFDISVDEVQVAKHLPHPQNAFSIPQVWTASRIRGKIHIDNQEIEYDFHQAKGAPKNEKYLHFLDEKENSIWEVDLSESGWFAHARMLKTLLQPTVDMRHTITDAISVMKLIDHARNIAQEIDNYHFGTLPSFLRK